MDENIEKLLKQAYEHAISDLTEIAREIGWATSETVPEGSFISLNLVDQIRDSESDVWKAHEEGLVNSAEYESDGAEKEVATAKLYPFMIEKKSIIKLAELIFELQEAYHFYA